MTPNNDAPWWDNDQSDDTSQPWWDQEAVQPDSISPPQHTPTDTSLPHEPKRTVLQHIFQWINANLHTTLYMIIGFVLALSILHFGFWRTFLVALFIGCGFLLGSLHDGNPRMYHRLRRFYQRWLEDNPFMKQ